MSQQRTAIVTGGGRGIGRSICIELVRNGFSVLAVSRTASELEETVNLMISVQGDSAQKCLAMTADVTLEDQVFLLFERAEQKMGSLHVLVNNAGYVDPASILEMEKANWDTTIASNLTSTFLCCREFVRRNKRRGGKIINIASTAGLTPRPGWTAYAAAKAGVINLSATLSEELRPYGITVYCIAPGRTATALRAKLAPDEDRTKILQPSAVGRLAALLACDTGAYLDGQPIVIRKPIDSE